MSEAKIIGFMKQRYLAAAFSVVLILASIGSFFVNGMSLGLDFTGGALVELKYEKTADLNQIRSEIAEQGYPGASVIYFGSDRDVQIRFQTDDPQKGGEVAEAFIANSTEPVELLRISYVGPQIGEELTNDGGLGLLFSLAVVMAYVALRFQFKFSVGAVAALIHDVIIVLGVFSIFQLDFDLTVLAAVLAVIGYSLNDTIVVADRIRENFRIVRNKTPREVIDLSLTQTLERTLITSLTTLLVLLALFFVGGEMIHNFALALIVGVVIGTYSSIYVAANVLLAMKISREDLLPPQVEKEGEELEELP
ncbi:protein translocase subunit SecF [Agaribacterium haliotis]|uniref:protein translocase subunit SecF n=1 Tax=Agaribacterium haliotis TaxID=2013869 RepID=UPI000BB5770F|nr:protein translocase subunit SecF [Agaribacterium haliotis]